MKLVLSLVYIASLLLVTICGSRANDSTFYSIKQVGYFNFDEYQDTVIVKSKDILSESGLLISWGLNPNEDSLSRTEIIYPNWDTLSITTNIDYFNNDTILDIQFFLNGKKPVDSTFIQYKRAFVIFGQNNLANIDTIQLEEITENQQSPFIVEDLLGGQHFINCFTYNDKQQFILNELSNDVRDCPILDSNHLKFSSKITQIGCFGNISGEIELIEEIGNPPYSYFWDHDTTLNSNIATSLDQGIYTVEVIDNNCYMWKDTFSIYSVESLSYQLIVEDVKDINDTCLFSKCNVVNLSGTPPYTVIWDYGEIGINQFENIVDSYPASHTVTIIDANGCQLTQNIMNNVCENNPYGTILVSPNPSPDIIDITINQLLTAEVEIEFFTQDYQRLYYDNKGINYPGLNLFSLNVSNYLEGLYYLVIKFDGNNYPAILVYVQ